MKCVFVCERFGSGLETVGKRDGRRANRTSNEERTPARCAPPTERQTRKVCIGGFVVAAILFVAPPHQRNPCDRLCHGMLWSAVISRTLPFSGPRTPRSGCRNAGAATSNPPVPAQGRACMRSIDSLLRWDRTGSLSKMTNEVPQIVHVTAVIVPFRFSFAWSVSRRRVDGPQRQCVAANASGRTVVKLVT
jgi:hypothetical protein